MSTVEGSDGEQYHLHLFTVNDPQLWEPRHRQSPEEIALEGITDEEWDTFHAIIAEA
jgi:hypothetical protein